MPGSVITNTKDKSEYNTMTIVLRYKTKTSQGTPMQFGQSIDILEKIVKTLQSYNNANHSSYCSDVNIIGMYIDPEEVSIDNQNDIYKKVTQNEYEKDN